MRMKTAGLWGRAVMLAAVTLAVGSLPKATAALQALKGDPEAVALARQMINQMGDRQVWARARWIYTAERAFYANRADPVEVAFWRRTTTPAEWGSLSTTGLTRLYAWTEKGGWLHRNAERRVFSREEIQTRVGWWSGEIYVMYHRLAREDNALRLVNAGERSFIALDDTTGAHLGQFDVASSGELVRWARAFGTDRVEYVYGPLKPFGKVRMPDWGTMTSGQFRFYYTDVRLSAEATPPVSLEPPRN